MLETLKYRLGLVRPILLPLALYLALLAFATSWLESNSESPWRYLMVVLPMVPGVFIALGALRVFRGLDELEQKIRLESMALSFIITLILMISLGLLDMVGVPQLNGAWVSVVMAGLWLVAKLWLNWRYR